MKNLIPTDLERMHYTDEGGRKRIATIKPNSVKFLLGSEVLSYQEYTRNGEPKTTFGLIAVEMISKRVPLARNAFYGTLESVKS